MVSYGASAMSISQAAAALGTDSRTLRCLAGSGSAPHQRFPGGYRRFMPEHIARIRARAAEIGQMYDGDGLAAEDLAQLLSIDVSAARSWLRVSGVEIRKTPTPKTHRQAKARADRATLLARARMAREARWLAVEARKTTRWQSSLDGGRPRNIPPRLRYLILQRDGFRCVACGRSPREHGVALQVDHILAWAHGGQTTPANLQALCEECNRGKGALESYAGVRAC